MSSEIFLGLGLSFLALILVNSMTNGELLEGTVACFFRLVLLPFQLLGFVGSFVYKNLTQAAQDVLPKLKRRLQRAVWAVQLYRLKQTWVQLLYLNADPEPPRWAFATGGAADTVVLWELRLSPGDFTIQYAESLIDLSSVKTPTSKQQQQDPLLRRLRAATPRIQQRQRLDLELKALALERKKLQQAIRLMVSSARYHHQVQDYQQAINQVDLKMNHTQRTLRALDSYLREELIAGHIEHLGRGAAITLSTQAVTHDSPPLPEG
ncbi:hypothetical protein [Candidatus Cyanaurora vandensis]|uniref:hypothetical protein n=1 Tax=Candidatus Cyanaurora vandensis TaxID=2714958 RepID=UPI00257BB1E3|nr:hypothetical protein [Candidatus Cyanaurora vandensis]